MFDDEAKINLKRSSKNGVVRENYTQPDGTTVESVQTVSYNEHAFLEGMKQGPGQDLPSRQLHNVPPGQGQDIDDVPASQDGFGNTVGGDVVPINKPVLGTMIPVPSAYVSPSQENPALGKFNELNTEAAPKRMRVGGEDLDILTIVDVIPPNL